MANAHLTDKMLRSLEVDHGRLELWDALVPGFGVRVSSKGSKAFMLFYRMGGRNTPKRRLTLGHFPNMSLADARARARILLGQIESGIDPQASDAAGAPATQEILTFGQLAEDYLRLHPKVGTRWWQEQKRVFDKELLPAWGTLPATAIKKREISALLGAIAARPAPVQANRTRSILHRLFTWGIRRDLVEFNPVPGTEKPAKELGRERVLNDEELRRAWFAFGELSQSLMLHLRFKLFTLQRGDEIRTMTRNHVSGDWWTIPRELTKMKRREHRVPLVPSALELLAQAVDECAGATLYFPSPKNPEELITISAPSKACSRLCGRHQIEPFTAHDLRRTAATHLGALGVDELLIARILSHTTDAGGKSVPAVTGIYNRYAYDKEKREALLLWEQKLLSILATPQEP